MLNVMRIMFLVYAGLFVLNTVISGLTEALPIFAEQVHRHRRHDSEIPVPHRLG